ncbi:MAG: DNA polymerase III subunit beta [Dehalococcoidia bacterium]|nr:DNA polymerase III subunit beta [Dehalococcoidia bacterium]
MKLSCLQENLSKGLNIVGRAVATRTTLPITNNVLLATDRSQLKLSATNLEIAISCWIGAKIESEGSITVPARLLNEFVNSLPAEKIDVSLAPKGRALEFKCARYDARISGMDADDFPPIPEVKSGQKVKLEPDVLRQAITKVAFAAAVEDSRPVLTGVLMEFDGDQMTMVAADGFRLAVQKAKVATKVQDSFTVIVPARALLELGRLLADQTDPVEITISANKSQILFLMKNVELVSQLIQGTFPNYKQLIPANSVTKTTVDVGEFLKATKAAAIFAKDASGIIRLQVMPAEGGKGDGARMNISGRSEEIGDNHTDIDATVAGDASKVAFNSRYLSEVLAVLEKGKIVLETSSPSSPGVIKQEGKDEYIHVVMPMFVQW